MCETSKMLLGAVAGDVIGSAYEFNAVKRIDFPLYLEGKGKWFDSKFTDDTVMTVAVADWLLSGESLIQKMQRYGRDFPKAGYGGMFSAWLNEQNPQPYNSFGNGSAMRVSPVGWAFDSMEETLEAAEETAVVSHNHPEGIKGAQAIAASIFLARNGKTKEEIKDYVTSHFGYNLNRTCDEIRPSYRFDVRCQGSVPESIICFLESKDYENTVRLAVSLGGDADTMAAMAGGIAEAFYGKISEQIRIETCKRLPNEFKDVLFRFGNKYKGELEAVC